MAETIRFCTFYLDGLCFGIEVRTVQEVIRPLLLTPVPLADDAVAGLLNLRGQIVAVIDLRRQLGLPARIPTSTAMLMVIRNGANTVCLLVDEAGDVLDAPPDLYEPVPASLRSEARCYLAGVYKLPQRLLHVLALEAVLSGQKRETRGTPAEVESASRR